MALQVAGVQVQLPAATVRPPGEFFEDLAAAFKLDGKITKYLVDVVKLSTLEEFRYLIRNEGEADIIIDKVPDLEDKPLMAARFRQSWLGVKDAIDKSDTLKKQGDHAEDLDAVLPTDQLDNLSTRRCG